MFSLTDKSHHLGCTHAIISTFTGTRLSLDTIKRRLQAVRYPIGDESKEDPKPPLFKVDVVLAIPNVVMKPNLEDLQHSLNKGVQIILKASQVGIVFLFGNCVSV